MVVRRSDRLACARGNRRLSALHTDESEARVPIRSVLFNVHVDVDSQVRCMAGDPPWAAPGPSVRGIRPCRGGLALTVFCRGSSKSEPTRWPVGAVGSPVDPAGRSDQVRALAGARSLTPCIRATKVGSSG